MNGCGRAARFFGIVGLMLGLGAARAMAQQAEPASLPVDAYTKNDKGLIVAQVQFAADGKVAACRIVRSNAPYPLEAATVDYIRRKWVNETFAGDTVNFPITFDELPWDAKSWNDGLVPPPNWLSPGDPGRKVRLDVTFGKDGWVQEVHVAQPSGIELVDQQTGLWVKVHWHSDKYAGTKVDVPFEFKSPPAPKPVVVKTPPKPEPAPEEEAAPPAVRVQ